MELTRLSPGLRLKSRLPRCSCRRAPGPIKVYLVGGGIASLAAAASVFHERSIPFAIFAVVSLWWIGAMVAVLRSFAPRPRLFTLGRAAALWAALLAVSAVVPHAPIFVGRDFDIRTANLWE